MPASLAANADEMERTYITNEHWYHTTETWWHAADTDVPVANAVDDA